MICAWPLHALLEHGRALRIGRRTWHELLLLRLLRRLLVPAVPAEDESELEHAQAPEPHETQLVLAPRPLAWDVTVRYGLDFAHLFFEFTALSHEHPAKALASRKEIGVLSV